jgi:hypothetical protein
MSMNMSKDRCAQVSKLRPGLTTLSENWETDRTNADPAPTITIPGSPSDIPINPDARLPSSDTGIPTTYRSYSKPIPL